MGDCYGYAACTAYDDAVAGNGLGLRAAKAYDAQATGSADEGCSDDTISDIDYGVEFVRSRTASATATAADGALRDCVSG